jgi:predicted amidophosphoribosyltransferase
MPTIGELSAAYENFMFGPRPGPDTCELCFNFTRGFERCYACAHGRHELHVVAPISYSVAGEQLHHVLAQYKRVDGEIARRLRTELAAVLWRYLDQHEHCAAQRARTDWFPLVTTVPSSDRGRDELHPLREIIQIVGPMRERHERLLRRSDRDVPPHTYDVDKYAAVRRLDGEAVLLIDDTWTTGANAQSAAAALKSAGAGAIAAVVMGRHLNRDWHDNDRRLCGIRRPFDWTHCALCG